MRKSKYFSLFVLVLLLSCFSIVSTAFAADPMPGAIYTTDPTGRDVNQNVFYTDKTQVYLNGGPEKEITKLPEGDYYIKVTAPDGTLLGTTVDAKDRPQTYHINMDGKFVFDPLLFPQYMLPEKPISTTALIQVYAATKFKPTTNSGGEYKVWISTDRNFSSSLSKTDNFKVKIQQPPTLNIEKFNDLNNNGVKDPDEKFINWRVTILNKTTGVTWSQELNGYGTGVDGTWKGLVDPGEYIITEDSIDGWVATTPISVTTPNLTSKGFYKVIFGNRQLAKIDVKKFKDLNANGKFDEGIDEWISWSGKLAGVTKWGKIVPEKEIKIPLQGFVEPGTYTVTEDTLVGWQNTTPITVGPKDVAEGETYEALFGNIPLSYLKVIKFNDANNNQIMDGNEPLVPGWKARITGKDILERPVDMVITLKDGTWSDYLFPGTYTVTEDSVAGWINTTATSETITLKAEGKWKTLFGNRKLRPLNIIKFYDADRDKAKDDNEVLLPWRVHINGSNIWGEPFDKDIDLVNGEWQDNIDPGKYTITEYLPSNNWFATTATSQTIELTPDLSADIPLLPTEKVSFGNLYMGIGGHTHGFWGNPNGEALFNSDPKYLDAINSLALVDEAGLPVTPFLDGYNTYAPWNQDANATNMAYMLSCQLGAMKLNATAGAEIGFVNENSIILIGDTTPIYVGLENVNKDGFIFVKDLIAAANEALIANPDTRLLSSARDYQVFLEKVIDRANQDNAAVYLWLTPPNGPYFN